MVVRNLGRECISEDRCSQRGLQAHLWLQGQPHLCPSSSRHRRVICMPPNAGREPAPFQRDSQAHMYFRHSVFRQPDYEPVRIHVVNLFRYRRQQKRSSVRVAALPNNWYGVEIVRFEKRSSACFTRASSLLYDRVKIAASERLNG